MEKKQVDCVVIGTGMGGTTAAALMAHYGYKVLVAEKRCQVGGRFSTQEINGFKCPTGALIIQRGTELEETFKLTGAKFEIADCAEISWKIGNEIYPLLGKGTFTKTLPAALKNFRWRHYRFGIMSMLMMLKTIISLLWRKWRNLFRKEGEKIERSSTVGKISYREWMEKYTHDPRSSRPTMPLCRPCLRPPMILNVRQRMFLSFLPARPIRPRCINSGMPPAAI